MAADRATSFLWSVDSQLRHFSVAKFLSDQAGTAGAVRDVIFEEVGKDLEIGISCKSNSDTIRNPRLSQKIDFGKKWGKVPASPDYWESVSSIFDELAEINARQSTTNFSDLEDKEGRFYAPVIEAFLREFISLSHRDDRFLGRTFNYLTGAKEDYYFVNFLRAEQTVHIKSFNLKGNLEWGKKVPNPSFIDFAAVRRGHPNTAIVGLEGGWTFSFRIHNAEKFVTPSLKLDVKLIGHPSVLYQHHILVP